METPRSESLFRVFLRQADGESSGAVLVPTLARAKLMFEAQTKAAEDAGWGAHKQTLMFSKDQRRFIVMHGATTEDILRYFGRDYAWMWLADDCTRTAKNVAMVRLRTNREGVDLWLNGEVVGV